MHFLKMHLYELLNNFDSVSDLDKWLSKEYGENISKDDINNAQQRDIYGDY